jgi:ribokinase
MAYRQVIGLGALNWDLIYELPDFGVLRDLDISMVIGEEIHLESDMLDPLLDLLGRHGKKRAESGGGQAANTIYALGRHGKKRAESGGGQAANTIYALTRMGFRTMLMGKVGRDEWGDLILKGLSGIDIKNIIREGRSGICISILTPDGERSMIAFPNVNDTLELKDIDITAFDDCHFIHLTSFAGPCPLKAQIELVKGLRQGPLISFDPGNLYAEAGLDAISPILKRTYCLFSTDNELERITGLHHQRAAIQMLDLGVQMVICKQGSKGAYLLDRQRRLDFPAMEVEVKDVTGAGDCFAAGFLAGLIMGEDPEVCGFLGTYAAASCITGYGRESYPNEEILNRITKKEPVNNF